MITTALRVAVAACAFLGLGLIATASAADKNGPWYEFDERSIQPKTWSGIYVGGNVGYQVGDTTVDGGISDTNQTFASGYIDGLSSRGWKYGVRAGVDWQVGSSPFVIGAFAGYDWGESDFDAGVGAFGSSVGLNVSVEPTWHIGARAGLAVSNSTLVYVGYAYGQAEVDVRVPASFGGTGVELCSLAANANVTGLAVNCSDTLDGHTFLTGVEFRMTEQLTAGLEYSYTQYDGFDVVRFANGGVAGNVSVEPDVHAVSLRVNWRPNFNLF